MTITVTSSFVVSENQLTVNMQLPTAESWTINFSSRDDIKRFIQEHTQITPEEIVAAFLQHLLTLDQSLQTPATTQTFTFRKGAI